MLMGSFLLLSLAAALSACFGCGFGIACLWVAPLTFLGSFLGLLVLAFLFLVAVIAPLKSDAVREGDSRFYRTVTNLYIELLVTLVGLRFETVGLEKRPKEGRFLLVSNHLHEIDPAMFMHLMPKSQLAFIAKQEIKGFFLAGKILPQLQCPYINRENDREALKTILRSIQLLKEDRASVAVFPEGGINKLRKFKQLKPGVFKIAQKAKVPILICTLQGTERVISNLLKLKRSTVKIHFLELVTPEWMEGKTTVEIAEYVHGVMAADLGPENCYPEENT